MADKPALETARLILRRFLCEDVDDLHDMLGDPEVMKYYPAVKTKEETQVWLDRILESYETTGLSFWVAILKTSGETVGQIGLIDHQIPEIQNLEIGYLLKRRHWGQGYATEAARACRDFAFGELGQSKVISMIDPRNHPSIRVAKRVGMKFEQDYFVTKFEKVISIFSANRESPQPDLY